MKSQYQQILGKYNYKKDKPAYSNNNYSVWHAIQNQTNIPVTIKILKFPHIQLPKYLKKLKEVKSEFVIKIYQVIADQSSILMITQQATYGTLKKAMAVCQHLDQNDSIFMARTLLNGHVDMLRADCNWFGTEDDIEFTDTGPKLSWNNSCPFNLANPFPNILAKFVNRNQAVRGVSLLPFPQIKAVSQLIKICKQNASEISLHPQMKTKIKFSRRKGKDWIGIRQVKNKNQYFDELSYLAVSKQYGFVRVKVYQLGKISPNLLQFNKTKTTFTKVLQVVDQGDKTVVISEYSNDGNLENYIKRLKSSGINLKQEHIQFFFYSLFDPIKSVQQSTLKSINMLHIKNIYIENGIPKVGEPIPLNQKVNQILADRADVPDFYHINFKKDSTSHDVSYDTYSLGVLLYKLMYTEYPIFPNGKVHIPTTPNYNKRLKTSLQIFLNEGGSLSELQSRIQISENVLKQVKVNKQKLMQGFVQKDKKRVLRKQNDDQEQSQDKAQTLSKISIVEQQKKQEQISESDSDDDVDGCCNMILARLKLKPAQKMKQTSPFIDILQQSPYKKCRLWTKIILIILIYIFMFYYTFLGNNVSLLANQNLLQKITVSAGNTTYNITTTNYFSFQNDYSNSPTISNLLRMNCAVDGYNGAPIYSSTAYNTSGTFITFLIFGIISLSVVLLIKAIQINYFDQIKALSNRQNGKGKFNLANFILVNLIWQTLIAGHFFLFNFIYYGKTEPCLGFTYGVQYGSTDALFQTSNRNFSNIYMGVFISQLIFSILYLIIIGCNESINYNKILNPITIFGGGYFIFVLIVRFGAIMKTYYYPSVANDPNQMISGMFNRGELVGILGVLPQILLLIEITLSIIVDWGFWWLVDKSHSLLGNDASVVNDNGLNELV